MLNFKTFLFSEYFRLYLVSPKENDNLELINYLGLKVWSSTDISSPTGPCLNFIHFNDLEKHVTLTGENIFPSNQTLTGTKFSSWLLVGYHHHRWIHFREKVKKKTPFCVLKHWSPVSIWSADRRFFKLPQTALSLSLWDAQIWRENLWERYGETGFLTLLIQIRQERLKWQNSLFY